MPARTRKQAETLPFDNRNPVIERMLTERYKVDFEFHSNVPVGQIDVARSRKNNSRTIPLDEDTVNDYIAALERDEKFPPIVAYRASGGTAKKYTVADGNHRVAAHAAVGRSLDVYVLDPSTPASTVVLITFTCNRKNGKAYSEEECISHAVYFVDNGFTQKDAAAEMGVKPHKLKAALDLREADTRASEAGIGIRMWEGLHPSSRARLNAITTNEILKPAATLAHDANMTTNQVSTLVAKLGRTKNPATQKEIIKSERALLKAEIVSAASGSRSKGGPQTPKGWFALGRSHLMHIPDNAKAVANLYSGEERDEAAGWYGDLGRRLLAVEKELLNA